jgi:hypothetical protein
VLLGLTNRVAGTLCAARVLLQPARGVLPPNFACVVSSFFYCAGPPYLFIAVYSRVFVMINLTRAVCSYVAAQWRAVGDEFIGGQIW